MTYLVLFLFIVVLSYFRVKVLGLSTDFPYYSAMPHTQAHTHTHIHIFTHAHTHTHTHIHTHTHTLTLVVTGVKSQKYLHTHTNTHIPRSVLPLKSLSVILKLGI